MARPSPRIIPGFPLTLGYTLTYLSLLVMIPLGALVLKSAQLSWGEFWGTMTDPTVVAAFKVTFKSATLAAIINAVFGLLVAWVLVRYPMPGRRFFDAMIDFPFALPTAVAGLTFSNLYLKTGWIGGIGAKVAGALNWVLAHAGATGLATFRRVIFPQILPAWLSGTALSFARAVGEYGSVIFISSGIPGQGE